MSGIPLADLIRRLPASHASMLLEVRDPSTAIDGLDITRGRALDLAGSSDLAFCKSDTPQLLFQLRSSSAVAIVVPPSVADHLDRDTGRSRVLLLSSRPRSLLAGLLAGIPQPPSAASQAERIHPSAQLGQQVTIGPGVVLGEGVQIGDGCTIGPNSVIEHTSIGTGTHIGANCSLGGDGFGYEIDEVTGTVTKFPHFGRVLIGSDVEIFSNACIARGSLRDTVIEDGVKIDNLVHVAHNCHIGRDSFIIANSMLGGSAVLGDHVWIAPSTAVMNGISMGPWSMTGVGACVTKSWPANSLVAGVPAKLLRQRLPGGNPPELRVPSPDEQES